MHHGRPDGGEGPLVDGDGDPHDDGGAPGRLPDADQAEGREEEEEEENIIF